MRTRLSKLTVPWCSSVTAVELVLCRSFLVRKAVLLHGRVDASLSHPQIILPWLMMTDKVHEQTRALGTISRLLRFICSFSELSVSI